jgi:N6-adenosine-specific RNA methylase IME4
MIYTNINDIQGEYNVIVADPPWHLEKAKRKTRPKSFDPLDYPTMSLEEIQNHLQIALSHTSENAALFLWAIEKYLPETLQMVKDLGLKRHIVLIWDKGQGIAPAYTVRFTHEYLIWAYKGKFQRPLKENQGKYASVFHAKPQKHSTKPEEAFQLIEAVNGWGGQKLEMYARSTRSGWDSFGNEVTELENKGGVEYENQIESTTS